jgi:hypothetical protein
MILVLRGHIRNSFDNLDLFNLIKEIYNIDNNLSIYIHTWNIIANNISWRHINSNNTMVTKETIYDYFGELRKLIDTIIIDDDKNIKLIGNLNGNINNGPMPIIGWKNYWYGKYKIIDYINNKKIDANETIINMRFDIMSNSNNFYIQEIIDFIKNNIGKEFNKNIFIKDYECNGIDNIYLGNINSMYKLTHYFNYFLDDILVNNTDTTNQERLVYRINKNRV